MNAFNKGDRIIFVEDDHYFGVEMPNGTLATYDDDRPTERAPWVRLDTGKRVLTLRARIAPYDEDHGTGDGSASDICAEPGCNCDLERRFPAPLDPSKVKAGDTVTVTDGKATITGVVDSVRERAAQLWFRFRFGEPADACFEVPLSDRFGEAFTLTAHTPAPEPEPEWKPGDMAAVTARGWVNAWSVRTATNDGWASHDNTADVRRDDEVEDVRPLVVLDPESDADRLWNIIRAVDGNHDLGAGALAEAILERLSR